MEIHLDLVCLGGGGLVVAADDRLGELDLGGGDLDGGVEDVPHAEEGPLEELVAEAVC